MQQISLRCPAARYDLAKGMLGAAAAIVLTGTIAAFWQIPLFMRITPIGLWETPALIIAALRAGVCTTVRSAPCRTTE